MRDSDDTQRDDLLEEIEIEHSASDAADGLESPTGDYREVAEAGAGVSNWLASFFGVVARGRSYLNVLYLLLAFPLGIAYFVFLSIGWSLGLGLLLLWIGLIVLLVVLGLSWLFSAFERQQAIHLLGADVRPMWPVADAETSSSEPSVWSRFVAFLGNRVTWTGMLFLLLKFPLGVASFIAAVTTLSVSLSLLLAPFYYRWEPPELIWWRIDTLPEALAGALLGALLLIASLHLLNGLAWLWKGLSRSLLGHGAPHSASA